MAKPIDATRAINVSLLLVACALAICAFWLFQQARSTVLYAQAGYAACQERFNPEYLNACNVQRDGPSCQHETRSRLKDWYMEVDYRCARAGPDVVFVFDMTPPVYEEANLGD